MPNDKKYFFQETAYILHKSAETLSTFSGYRASEGWKAISLYASNLLAQPWRKEYRVLQTFSGYYKHEIEANLIRADLMFELMGYKRSGPGILTLDGPIDPDKVSNVSRDAIVAYVECQILKKIFEIISKSFTVSWIEIMEYRENNFGTPEQAIRGLNHRMLERLHHSRVKSCFDSSRNNQKITSNIANKCNDDLDELFPLSVLQADKKLNYYPQVIYETQERETARKTIENDKRQSYNTIYKKNLSQDGDKKIGKNVEESWEIVDEMKYAKDIDDRQLLARKKEKQRRKKKIDEDFLKNGEEVDEDFKRKLNLSLDLIDFNRAEGQLIDEGKKKIELEELNDKWNCVFCTFLNAASLEICKMCGKSRRRLKDEKTLESGGKQCPQCTLINEKNSTKCEACDASLDNSPTYV